MDELLEQFLIEGRDLVAAAHEALAALARNPADGAALDSGFRAFHTLKGSVGVVGLARAERLLHAAEEVLSAARKQQFLAVEQNPALIDCIDQVDRWIDTLEGGGELGDDAEITVDLIAELTSSGAKAAGPSTADPDATSPAWLARLIEEGRDAIGQSNAVLVAFRYAPDAECFYRGEDPLGFAASAPSLQFLRIEPVEPWPEPAAFDPFRCAVIIEGLCAAPLAEVRQVFRLLAGQVEFAEIGRREEAEPEVGALPAVAVRGLRIDTDRLDRLGEDVREVIIATNGLAALAADADRCDRELAARIRLMQAGIERATGRLRQSATALRRVTLATALRRLPRLVRDIAGGLGKTVRFEMRGETIEADKDIVDGLFEPLLHLARNAIDHGIEDATSRMAAGKPAEGKLTLDVVRHGNEIVVTLEDDGSGIDPERIRTAAVERGVLTPAASERLTPSELQNLIFAPGFSTAVMVTEISGRGVGMDAVRAAMERLGGRIELESRAGAFTRFVLRLPVMAVTTHLLVVALGDDRYAVPFEQIRGTLRLARERLLAVGTGCACILRDRTVPVLSLAELLGEPAAEAPEVKLLITELFDGSSVALRVDDFEHAVEGIVRPRAGLLARAHGVQGTAIRPDGSVLLVLNLAELVG